MIAFLVLETMMVGIFCALDFVAVLCVLRGRAGPDVPDHRGVGRAAAGLFRLQVLPLHAARLGAVAAGDHRGLFPDRQHRHRRRADPRLPARSAEMAVAGVFRLVRGQGADVAGAHLAARRACRGADRRLGDPRRRPAEAGRLRLHPLLVADVPAGLGLFHAADLRAVARSRSSTPRLSRWRRPT